MNIQSLKVSMALILGVLAPMSVQAQMKIGPGDVCGVNDLDKVAGQAVCVCEVQAKHQSNPKEYPFYKMGCQKWLAAQSCDVRKVVDEYSSLDDVMADVHQVSHIKLGYVGHWSSSSSTVSYIEKRIIPLVEKYNTTVYYDNTACSGASRPIQVRDYINNLPSELKEKVIVKANENISVGEWDGILSPFIRSNAEITMCADALEVPSCRTFSGKGCAISLNHGDTVGCIDRDRNFRVLKCERKKEGRIRKLERGRWEELDISDQGAEVVRDEYHLQGLWINANVSGSYTDANGELKELDSAKMYINGTQYISIKNDTNSNTDYRILNLKQDYLYEIGKGSEDIDFFNINLFVEISDEDLNKVNEGYALKPNNSNLNSRRGTKQMMEHFRDNFNPIVNYYLMYRSEAEKSIYRY